MFPGPATEHIRHLVFKFPKIGVGLVWVGQQLLQVNAFPRPVELDYLVSVVEHVVSAHVPHELLMDSDLGEVVRLQRHNEPFRKFLVEVGHEPPVGGDDVPGVGFLSVVVDHHIFPFFLAVIFFDLLEHVIQDLVQNDLHFDDQLEVVVVFP